MCTWEDMHAHFFTGAISDDVMSPQQSIPYHTISSDFSNTDGVVALFLLVSSDLMQFWAGLGALFFQLTWRTEAVEEPTTEVITEGATQGSKEIPRVQAGESNSKILSQGLQMRGHNAMIDGIDLLLVNFNFF